MKRRCLNQNDKNYHHYGGRGISICNKWLEFDQFYHDMGDKPHNMTLERADVDGNYSLENCKWATWIEQHNNRRNNHTIDFNGFTLTMQQWSERLGMNPKTLFARIKRGWTIERAITQPVGRYRKKK